jgi:hypothetical protein
MRPREGRRIRGQERRQQDAQARGAASGCADSARNPARPFKDSEARTLFRHPTGRTEPGRRRQSSFASTVTGYYTPADVKARLQQGFNRRRPGQCPARSGASPRRRTQADSRLGGATNHTPGKGPRGSHAHLQCPPSSLKVPCVNSLPCVVWCTGIALPVRLDATV